MDSPAPVVLLSVEALRALREQLSDQPDGPERLWRSGFAQGQQLCRLILPEQRRDPARLARLMEAVGMRGLTVAPLNAGPGWRLTWEGSGLPAGSGWLAAGLASGLWSAGLGEDLLGLCAGDSEVILRDRKDRDAAAQERYRPQAEPPPASGTMQAVMDRAHRVAPLEVSVLITGESGVGKERLARTIHRLSGRSGPFVAIDCGSLPDSLLESELFGHARGAFTGAHQDRPGLFESAAGGTVLLDEVAEVPLALQTRLLRVLQEREVRRVGENRPRKVDVRVLAATHRDLAERCRQRLFREDLLFRLRVVELRLPALRERPEDILPLARRMVEAAAARHRQPVTGISPEAERALRAWSWPGNIRELENAMEQAVALTSASLIALQDLPADIRIGRSPLRPERLEDVERAHILSVLAGQQHNQLRAADLLGIGPSTLYRKLRRWREEGLLPEEFSQRSAGDSPGDQK